MTCEQWLKRATQQLCAAGIETARLDCLVLLEDVLEIDRARLLAEPAQELSAAQTTKLQKLLTLRLKHEPLAYVRGQVEFYGRTFVISPSVLVPRPESETMIELLKDLNSKGHLGDVKGDKVHIADIGTGSGALGITASLELPNAMVELLEIDPEAIRIANINVDLLTPGLHVVQSDLLSNSSQYYNILLCNLPYVPDDYLINQAAIHEPKLALYGGKDGLDLYRKLFDQLLSVQKRPLFILTESLPAQQSELATIAAQSGYLELQKENFIQVFTTKK